MKSIAIVIPAYNEKENILRLVQSIRKKLNCIIVIVDVSSDLITKKIIKKVKLKIYYISIEEKNLAEDQLFFLDSKKFSNQKRKLIV